MTNQERMAWCVFWGDKCEAICTHGNIDGEWMFKQIVDGATKFELLGLSEAREIFGKE